jgi:hypothetical protein
MTEERLQRRLAAILSAAVVGYSRLMGLDEAGTLSRNSRNNNSIWLDNIPAERPLPQLSNRAGAHLKLTTCLGGDI